MNIKIGIDYYPKLSELTQDEKDLRYKYGAVGMGLYYAVLDLIYSGEGYYCKIAERNLIMLASDNKLTIKQTTEIIKDMVRYKLFDKEKFEKYHILTNYTIQQNFYKVAQTRKYVKNLVNEYLLDFTKLKIENKEILSENSQNLREKSKINIVEKRKEESIVVNNINTNVFNTSYEGIKQRAKEHTEEERQPYKNYYAVMYMWQNRDMEKVSNEIIDTMIDALEQSSTQQGLIFKELTYYKDDVINILLNINKQSFESICISLLHKATVNKAYYILSCLINQARQNVHTAYKYEEDYLIYENELKSL